MSTATTYYQTNLTTDITYLKGVGPQRGGALELRLHGCDPDAAARRAQALGYEVIQTPTDKAHGLRETYLVDSDGYLWVPDMPVVSVSKRDHHL